MFEITFRIQTKWHLKFVANLRSDCAARLGIEAQF